MSSPSFTRTDTGDWSPLGHTSAGGRVEVARVLLERGADAKAQGEEDYADACHIGLRTAASESWPSAFGARGQM